MQENLYQTPQSDIVVENETLSEFYIVSPKKFLILFFSTLGLYSIYWFYQNWSLYKIKHKENIWPVPRSIFQIFFAHSLFEKIDIRLRDKGLELSWSPSGLATGFVILSIIETSANRAAFKEIGSPVTDLIGFAILPTIGMILYKVQKMANLAMGNIHGPSNSKLTVANYLWIGFGSLYWLIIAFGYYIIIFEESSYSY